MATDRVPKRVRLPYRPIVAIGEGQTVQLGQGDFWCVERATVEMWRGASTVFLWLSPLNPGDVVTGYGELIDPPPVEIEVM